MFFCRSVLCANKKPPPPAEIVADSHTNAAKRAAIAASKALPPASKIKDPARAVSG